jgi:Tfp pilus assembly protein PilZ
MQEMFKLARRRDMRIKTDLVVAHREPGIYTEDFYYYDTMTSLSVGGCFVQTENPYPIGSAIELVFCVGSATRSLKIIGKVCRHGGGAAGAEKGMGISFETPSESDRAALESFIMSQLGTVEVPVKP